MLQPMFRGNWPTGSRRFLKGFTRYGPVGHLGHVTSIMLSNFHFLVPESFHTKFGSDRHSSFVRKSSLYFFMYTTLGQGQEMTLTFNTHIFSNIQSDVCSFYLSGYWLQKFLKNPLFSLFPIEKPKSPNLTLP